ncbi:pheromone A receptor-domain-containing protein [Chaetomium sp. MPI-SDFR-AT-0129]|nr:pheromone A receptor-domain-containing protein [Chaetomium sp. MPI-SDFR-AT-0129]
MTNTTSNTTPTDPNKWATFGFTTSSTDRLGPPAPYTTPPLQINLFFRVFLGLLSLFITWVPARLLWRNGEFAGTVLCTTLLVLNLITVINALLWRDNDVSIWWSGEGWCDVMNYTYFPLHTAFNICMFEIMRGLAGKVALRRAVQPTRGERQRQRVVSAVVIFGVPIVQAVMTYFVTFGRYNVGTLVGCAAVYYPGWMYLVVYILPTPVFAVLAAYYAALTFYRYRKIEAVTRDIAQSHDGLAAARQDRVRKKLYFMTLVCIVVVLPLVMVILFVNIAVGSPWTLPYDFDLLHFGPDPYNDAFISFTTTDRIAFTTLNLGYVAELSGIVVFFPFGTTPEALNMYRAMLVGVGLGTVFPRLKDEYVPRPSKKSGGVAGTGWVISWNSLATTLRGRARYDLVLFLTFCLSYVYHSIFLRNQHLLAPPPSAKTASSQQQPTKSPSPPEPTTPIASPPPPLLPPIPNNPEISP